MTELKGPVLYASDNLNTFATGMAPVSLRVLVLSLQHANIFHTFITSAIDSDKPVTDISGIGLVLAKHLTMKGIDKAYILLGQLLVFRKNACLEYEYFGNIEEQVKKF